LQPVENRNHQHVGFAKAVLGITAVTAVVCFLAALDEPAIVARLAVRYKRLAGECLILGRAVVIQVSYELPSGDWLAS